MFVPENPEEEEMDKERFIGELEAVKEELES